MSNLKSIEAVAAVLLALAAVEAYADWKGDVARRAVGRAVREGLENALQDAALDAALDTVTEAVTTYAAPPLREVEKLDTVGAAVADAVESAMRVADVASTLDNVADVAKTVKKIKKLKR